MRLAVLCALLGLGLCAEPTAVDHVRDKLYVMEEDLWKKVTHPSWKDSGLGGDIELTKAFSKFNDEEILPIAVPRLSLRSWLWQKASEKMQITDGMFKSFVEFVGRQSVPGAVPAPVKDWIDLADNILKDPKLSVSHAIRKLEGLLEHGDLFRSALQEDHPELCELQLSQHQLIYDMYNTITLTEIKGYAMMQFSWMLLRIYGKGNYTQEANLTRQRYGERSARTAAAARAALAMARRDIYRCDPPQHIEGTTFEQVTRLLQGYIENEVDMNPEGTCGDNCAYYTLAKRHGCFKDQFCAKQEACNGRILDCQYIDSDMWVCPAAKGSGRRYEFIEYENGRTLGRAGSCTRGNTKVDSWWRPSLYHCSYCFCLCEDHVNVAQRTFSLKEAVSDIKKNKVVTGVSLIKLGKVFHLRISEGTLLERGSVAPGAWVAVQSFDPQDSDVREGIDYHSLTYERRAIDLDVLDSPNGHALTGIKFMMIGAHLHFAIRVTPFNWTSGRMHSEKSRWITNDNTEGAENPRSRLELFKPDIPTRGGSPLPVDSRHDQYVEFINSDFDADAAQSTVPFIDIQPVQPMTGAGLMSGAGLIHRGARGSGGFIALKLIEYDKTSHVKAEAPPSSYDEDGETTEFLPIVN